MRSLIVVNKYWECDPVCWALTSKYLYDTCGVKLPSYVSPKVYAQNVSGAHNAGVVVASVVASPLA